MTNESLHLIYANAVVAVSISAFCFAAMYIIAWALSGFCCEDDKTSRGVKKFKKWVYATSFAVFAVAMTTIAVLTTYWKL